MRCSPLRAAIVLGLAASLLLLSGCGNDEPAADAASASATPTPTPTSASPSATPTPTPKPKPIKASNNFDKVTVTGGYGDTPKVKVDTPWAIDKTRTKVLDASNGP
ncbi:MAG TPA: peptidylprolyl isomerase, partial [Propionibacteriaceae bacterium]|nr:peptidylprolyl isomerase [Propionibacteriaceae bacterium]